MNVPPAAAGLAALLLAALPLAAACAAPPPVALDARLERALARRDPAALADTVLPRLAALDSAQRALVARRIAGWPVAHRVAAWAFLQVGTPYALGPLGEERPPDADPVLAFAASDCAVLNLVSAALAHAPEAGGERAAMALAHYRDGVVAFETRFHFTTDRLDASPYFRDVTRAVGGSLCRARRVTLNRRADGGRWVAIDWSREREVTWIPRVHAGRVARWHAAGRIPDALGVAFVRERALGDGLDVVHESLLWKGRTMLHASSATGRVVALPWSAYLAGPGRGHDGFVLFEYR